MKKTIVLAIIATIGFHSVFAQCNNTVIQVGALDNTTVSVNPPTVSVPPNTSATVEVPTGTPFQVEIAQGVTVTIPAPSRSNHLLVVSVIMPTVIYINGVVWPATMDPLPVNGRKFNLTIPSSAKIIMKKEDVRSGNQIVKKTVIRVNSTNAAMKEINPTVIKAN